jgi:cation:H+ antiporter
MLSSWIQLILMLVVILASAQILTNALEYLGQKMHISEGVTGSLFAAVATALPEASIPIIALLAGTQNQAVNEEVSVGAILGAPLMLSTLSIFLMGCAVLKSRGIWGKAEPEKKGLIRDVNFFLIAFSLAAIAMYIPHHLFFVRIVMGTFLVALYVFYIYLTCKASKQLVMEGHGVTPEQPLLLTRIGLKSSMGVIIMQLVVGLGLLLLGAKGFIAQVEYISHALSISALLLSLLIIPIATELPEKVNSILWIRRGKDTLAFGNITGAMVFQGTLLPALGIWLTPWHPSKEVLWGIIIALIAAAWLRVIMLFQNLRIAALLINGILYVVYLWLAL